MNAMEAQFIIQVEEVGMQAIVKFQYFIVVQ